MSFDSPERLILIVAPIVMIVAYLIAQRAKRKNALRFTSVDLLASVAPKRSPYRVSATGQFQYRTIRTTSCRYRKDAIH